MDKETIKLLESERKKRVEDITQKLLKGGSLDIVEKNMGWIRLSDQLTNSLQSSKSTRLFWSFMIGAICMLVIGFAWTQRIHTTQLSFEVVSPNVSIKLSEDWALNESLDAETVYINSLDTVLAPELDIKFQRDTDNDEEPSALDLKGNNITLRELTISNSVLLDLAANKNKLTFAVKGKPLKGTLELKKAEITLTEEDDEINKELNLDDSEFIDFTTSVSIAEPVKIEVSMPEKSWTIRDFRTTTLEFLEEYPPNSGDFESTVKSGRVELLETGTVEELREDDVFLLEGIVTRRLELSKNEGGIKVYFEGSASSISAGPSGYERNLAPTYLEYIYHQEKLAFFWSTVVFIWGLLWSWKNTIFAK